jgi:hypothetical protein
MRHIVMMIFLYSFMSYEVMNLDISSDQKFVGLLILVASLGLYSRSSTSKGVIK